MKATDISDPEYFHRVVDCQYACPAHTAVPEYIRLIAAGRHADAYMLNWESNVFPGILGRTCDRPCEPACRRGRLGDGQEAVAICRLKRVAADHKGEIGHRLPKAQTAAAKNGHRIALIGAGPASLTVARDLIPLGYEVHIYDDQKAGGGMMRSQIPAFQAAAISVGGGSRLYPRHGCGAAFRPARRQHESRARPPARLRCCVHRHTAPRAGAT